MISKFKLIRNIGIFDSVQGNQDTQLNRLTLIYAENARGKTTLSAILRSLGSSDPNPIIERFRLGSPYQPHVLIECIDSAQPIIFQNNSWTNDIPDIVIFDDMFIDQNVSSGLTVEAGHRQNLHEVVIGAQGVDLAQKLDKLAIKIDKHNTELRKKADLIPQEVRGSLTVDEFCELNDLPDIDKAIKTEERRYTALKNAEEVRIKPLFSEISLPSLNIDDIRTLLSRGLPDLDTQALKKIREHFDKIGEGGELWIEQGFHRIYKEDDQSEEMFCPFCALNLKDSYLFDLYRIYFSEAYSNLIGDIDKSIGEIKKDFGGDAIAGFQEKVMKLGDLHRFWTPLCDISEIKINTVEIVKSWQEVRKIILDALTNKKASPIECFELDKDVEDKVKIFQDYAESLEASSKELLALNEKIRQIKDETSSGNVVEVLDKLYRLKTTKKRYSSDIISLCDDYLKEKEAKKQTEEEKIETRKVLDNHRNVIFPKYQAAINKYLRKFNASFQIGSVIPTNPRGRPSCSYCLIINDMEVPLEPDDYSQVSPTFKNTLSSGDRNTLALAFFFASFDQDPALSQRIVIIDDPVTSLDDYREISTAQEIQSLIGRTAQVIVLSHDKRFLCKIWEAADKGNTATLEVKRASSGSSTIERWNIHPDTLDDNDIRHEELRKYNEEGIGDKDKIAKNIRFVLEKYCRVIWPGYCPPGFKLGQFKRIIHQSLSLPRPILDPEDYQEFSNLIEYAHKFHHETNLTWEDEIRNIRDRELQGFVRRTLEFIRHK